MWVCFDGYRVIQHAAIKGEASSRESQVAGLHIWWRLLLFFKNRSGESSIVISCSVVNAIRVVPWMQAMQVVQGREGDPHRIKIHRIVRRIVELMMKQ